MPDPLKDIHGQSFVEGQQAAAREVSAQRFEDQAALMQRAAQVAAETIDIADSLANDGNPQKQRIADIVKEGIIGAMGQVASGRLKPQEERAPLEDDPFSGGLPKSVTASPGSTKALPHEPSEQPVKRGRGRPRKNPPSSG